LTRHLLTELDPVSRLMLLFSVKLLVSHEEKPVETVEGEVIEGVAEADDVQAVVLVDSSIGGEEIQ